MEAAGVVLNAVQVVCVSSVSITMMVTVFRILRRAADQI